MRLSGIGFTDDPLLVQNVIEVPELPAWTGATPDVTQPDRRSFISWVITGLPRWFAETC
jgi:hypothetical protein